MTAVSGDAYFDVLDDIVNKYNSTVHFDVLDYIVNKYNSTVPRTIKMKPIHITSDSYPEYNVDSNEKDPGFNVGDYVRISKFKDVFSKG